MLQVCIVFLNLWLISYRHKSKTDSDYLIMLPNVADVPGEQIKDENPSLGPCDLLQDEVEEIEMIDYAIRPM